ncbi:MAG: phosphoadenosine phosphosulfate reductase family protein, partial [Mesorhizobium sp.]
MLAKLEPLDAEGAAVEQSAALEEKFGSLAPQDVIALSVGRFDGAGIGAVSSFGSDSAVLLHMIARIDPALQVIFLDTGKHFEETMKYRDALTVDFGLRNVRVYEPLAEALASRDP